MERYFEASAQRFDYIGEVSRFNKNTHRQVVLDEIIPPNIEPSMLASANTEDIIPVYFP